MKICNQNINLLPSLNKLTLKLRLPRKINKKSYLKFTYFILFISIYIFLVLLFISVSNYVQIFYVFYTLILFKENYFYLPISIILQYYIFFFIFYVPNS